MDYIYQNKLKLSLLFTTKDFILQAMINNFHACEPQKPIFLGFEDI